MPYSTSPTDVRELAGGLSTSDFSDAEIVEEEETARDLIDLKTGRTWSTDDSIFELIVRIENLLAASLVLDHGGPDMRQSATEKWDKGMKLLEAVINTELSGVTGSGALFASSNYKSYILGLDDDPDTLPHKSSRPSTYLY
jgi:hypothetical protein